MPLSKCTNAQPIKWVDNEGRERTAFRLEWMELHPNQLDVLTGRVRPRYITLFGSTPEQDALFQTLVDNNKIEDQYVMSYAQEVKPYCRVYTQTTKNHQANEFIMDEVTGKPRIYTTITVHCLSEINKEGKETPRFINDVIRVANNQRDYFINNDDSNGIRRYWEPETTTDDEIPDDVEEVPAEVFAPKNAEKPTGPTRPVMPKR